MSDRIRTMTAVYLNWEGLQIDTDSTIFIEIVGESKRSFSVDDVLALRAERDELLAVGRLLRHHRTGPNSEEPIPSDLLTREYHALVATESKNDLRKRTLRAIANEDAKDD